MASPFDLNRFFKAPIIKIDNRVRPPNLVQRELDECQKEVNGIIDRLGRASSKAQHLHTPVTTSSKLASSKHFMYLFKDPEGNGGYGLAIGFLKIGFKKLYVYDLKGKMHEREPLCVLDFYISESYQRQGYGKRLYDHMLTNEKVEPAQMAIDRPSWKFSSFLKKHYDLSHSIPQTNNFVVFEDFFSKQSEDGADRNCKSAGVCHRAVEPLNSKPQTESILPNMVETLSTQPSSSEDSASLTPPAGPVRSPDTTCQLDGGYLPSIKEPQLDDQCQLPKQTNIPTNPIIDPCNHQLFTTTKRVAPNRCGLETGHFTPTPLASMYSRHLATIGWPQPSEFYVKRVPNNEASKAPSVSPSPVQNMETLNNVTNERGTTMRFYADTFCGGGGRGKRTTAYMEPAVVRLPAVDNIYYQPLQPKTSLKPSNAHWSLFNNTPTYRSLLHRGYSHTRLW